MCRYTGRSSLKKTPTKVFLGLPPPPPLGTFSESAHDYVYNLQQPANEAVMRKKVLDVEFIMYFIFRIGTQTIRQEEKIYFNPPVSDIFEKNKLRQTVSCC